MDLNKIRHFIPDLHTPGFIMNELYEIEYRNALL